MSRAGPSADARADTWSSLFAAQVARDAPAIETPDTAWRSRELFARAGGAADWLDALGVSRGRPIATLVESSPHAFALALAGITTDRVLAPMSTRATEAELVACLEPLGASLLVADASCADRALAVGAKLGLETRTLPSFEATSRVLPLDADPEALVAIIHTSGTSGLPKPVPCRQDRAAARARAYENAVGIGPGRRYATASPFHHTAGFGMLLVALANGATLMPMRRFSAEAWDDLVRREVTHGMLVPSMIDQLLDEGRLAPGALRVLQYGASQIHAETLERMMHALPGVEIIQIYGQTEGAPITRLSHDDHRRAVAGEERLLTSAGRALPGVELRVHEPSEEGIGEIWARAPWLYVTNDEGWRETGDVGWIDEEGYLQLVGRKGDMIIRGGENVYPEEVERVIAAHPAVREVAVVGLADRRLGERVCAWIVVREGQGMPEEEVLRDFARRELAGFKVPAEWRRIDALPRNAAGKVLRVRLRDTSPA